jgi:anti-anti-sigma factor
MKHLKTKRVGPVVVLSPQKSLYGDDETFDLQEAIHQNHKEGNRFLVINLAKVDRMNSLGLGFLIEGHKLYKDRGARMTLSNLNNHPWNVIAIVKLSTVFDIHDTEEEAIASFVDGDQAGEEIPPAAAER